MCTWYFLGRSKPCTGSVRDDLQYTTRGQLSKRYVFFLINRFHTKQNDNFATFGHVTVSWRNNSPCVSKLIHAASYRILTLMGTSKRLATMKRAVIIFNCVPFYKCAFCKRKVLAPRGSQLFLLPAVFYGWKTSFSLMVILPEYVHISLRT